MMLKCRIRVGGYDKKMQLKARACGKRAGYLVGGYTICEEHAQRLAAGVSYTVHSDGAQMPVGTPQKLAA